MDETSTPALDTGGTNWANWFQGVAGSVIGKYADSEFVRPYDVQAMRLQALGNQGYYTEGLAGTRSLAGLGISPGVLLLAGAALVAVLLLKD